jgi:hypothetical protein
MRYVFCLVLALAAIWATQIFGQTTSDDAKYYQDFSNRKPTPRPREIQGLLMLRVCSITGRLDNRFSEWAYIRPSFIVAIGNPPTSPDECVAIHGANGKRIFVNGSLEGVAIYMRDQDE